MKNLKLLGLAATLALAFGAQGAWSKCTPILIDLADDGIHLGNAGVGVYFDVDADGIRDHVQWVRAGGDEGFLALDLNGNGRVDDGGELFGVGTPLILQGRTAPNGFVALAQYDERQLGGNDDGFISAADAIWAQLRIWVDSNADGISTYGEMHSLSEYRLEALETIPRLRKYVDPAGNRIPFWAWATQRGHAPGRALMVDVFFRVLS
jgi:hypothetical protein